MRGTSGGGFESRTSEVFAEVASRCVLCVRARFHSARICAIHVGHTAWMILRSARLRGNRFEVLSDTAEPSEGPPRRRLVLISWNPGSDHEWDPDIESIARTSEVEVQDVLPIPRQNRVRVQHASATLDIVNFIEVLAQEHV